MVKVVIDKSINNNLFCTIFVDDRLISNQQAHKILTAKTEKQFLVTIMNDKNKIINVNYVDEIDDRRK
jgi:GMP synthase PP-ATPase subunit